MSECVCAQAHAARIRANGGVLGRVCFCVGQRPTSGVFCHCPLQFLRSGLVLSPQLTLPAGRAAQWAPGIVLCPLPVLVCGGWGLELSAHTGTASPSPMSHLPALTFTFWRLDRSWLVKDNIDTWHSLVMGREASLSKNPYAVTQGLKSCFCCRLLVTWWFEFSVFKTSPPSFS